MKSFTLKISSDSFIANFIATIIVTTCVTNIDVNVWCCKILKRKKIKKNKFNERRNYYFLVKVLLMIKSKPLWQQYVAYRTSQTVPKSILQVVWHHVTKSYFFSNKIETGSLNRKSHQHNDYKQNYSNRCSLEQNYCSSNKIIVVHAIITCFDVVSSKITELKEY